MGVETFIQEFRQGLEFRPVDGSDHAFIVTTRPNEVDNDSKMSAEDWDAFESDIADAFERVP